MTIQKNMQETKQKDMYLSPAQNFKRPSRQGDKNG